MAQVVHRWFRIITRIILIDAIFRKFFDSKAKIREYFFFLHNINFLIADSIIGSIAVCAGSGSSVLEGSKADLWITGEMSHHEVLDAVHNGTSIILCDHSNTERGFLKVFASELSSILNNAVSVQVSDLDADPLQIVWIIRYTYLYKIISNLGFLPLI